jgi:hypothetical protein
MTIAMSNFLLEYNIIHHLEDGTTDEGLLQVGVRQSHLVEQTRQNLLLLQLGDRARQR